MSVRVVPIDFSVWCDDCRSWVTDGIRLSKPEANRAANIHRRADRAKAAPPLVVHEAKLAEIA